jgi:hypothetical protein
MPSQGQPRSECAQGRRDWRGGQGSSRGVNIGGSGVPRPGPRPGGHGEASWGVKTPLDPPTWPALGLIAAVVYSTAGSSSNASTAGRLDRFSIPERQTQRLGTDKSYRL